MSEPKNLAINCTRCDIECQEYFAFGGTILCGECNIILRNLYLEDQDNFLTQLLNPKFHPEKL